MPRLFALSSSKPIARDSRGVTAVEFGLMAPVFLMMMMGGLDMAHTLYMQALLQGTVQKAARDSSLESGTEASNREAIDATIIRQVQNLTRIAEVHIDRRSFYSYTKAAEARAEAYTDSNNNGLCDDGEPFEDNNANGVRDADGGSAGQGGAQDAVVLTVDVDYPRLFPVHKLIDLFVQMFPTGKSVSMSDTVRLTAKTVLTNQPYGQKPGEPVPVLGKCK